MKTKRLTKWDIAVMIDEFDRDRGITGRMPVYAWVDYYTRQELVDHYNFLVETSGMGQPIQ